VLRHKVILSRRYKHERTTTNSTKFLACTGQHVHRPACRQHLVRESFAPPTTTYAAVISYQLKQEALLSQRGRAMLRLCIASIQNVERSLLLLVVSASDIPLRTIKFFSVLFSSAYSSMLQAVTNKHSMERRRLCHLHCMVVGNCCCHFVVRTFSNRSIASGAWPTVSYTQLRRR